MHETDQIPPSSDRFQRLISALGDLRAKWISQWKWISRLLTLGAVLFLSILFYQTWSELRSISWQVFLPSLLVSLLFYLLSVLLHMAVWIHMLSFYHRAGWRDIEIYMQTILMRRLPGGAWHWIGRSSSYSAHTTVGAGPVFKANIIEWLALIVTAVGVIGVFLTTLSPIVRVGLVVLSLVLGIALFNLWFSGRLAFGRRIIISVSWMIAYAGSWYMGGLILYRLIQAVYATDITVVESTAIWAMAGGVSMLMIVLPSGLGIRELSLTFLLQTHAPISVAILTALLIRLTFSLADVLWGASGWLISRSIGTTLARGADEIKID